MFLKISALWSLAKMWLKWRPGGAIRGKWGQLVGWEGRGVGMWQAGTSKVVASARVD
jgi:hypothetical protein